MAVIAAALLVGGCAPPHTPAEVARAWLDSVARDRPDEAWAAMSAEPRRQIRQPDLASRLQRLSVTDRERIEAAPVGPVTRTAEWRTPLGPVRFEHRGADRWVLVGPLPRFDRQDTPDQALATFERALRHRDFALMLQLAPPEERRGLSADALRMRFTEPGLLDEVTGALSSLRAVEGESVGPDLWRVRAGRHQADLVRLDGRWYLADLR